jgi:acetyltransferase-like isoleucine patch superfamily enzyme
MLNRFILRIKRKDNQLYASLYRLAEFIISFSIPSVKLIHLPLYYAERFVNSSLRGILHAFWYVPLFKARCEEAGKNLRLPDGIPLIEGSHLKIFLGDNVTIGRSTIGASKVFDEPILKIGSHSTIGYGTVISASKEVIIGEHCLIGPQCIIMDSDDHPINPAKRLSQEPVSKEDVLPVKIGNNVWIGGYCAILKGVTIGDNTVVATHSVVTRDAAGNCVYAGFPARPTLRDIDKGE